MQITTVVAACVFMLAVGKIAAEESEIVVGKNGTSDWQIMNASPDSEVCSWAAGELQKYIEKMSACRLPISEGDGEPALVIGLRDDLPPEDQAALPKQAAGYDGYSIAITDKRIIVGGANERGAVYGAYDLLERMGCRWFYPQSDEKDAEVVPRSETIRLKSGQTSIASPIKYRICNASAFFFEIDPPVMKAQLDAAMKARYNGIGWQCDHRSYVGDQYKEMERAGVIAEVKKRGMLLHGPAHSFPHFLKNDYFDEHPDWFGMRDGKRVKQVFGGAQFCWSNVEARRKFVDNAEEFVLASPGLDIFCTLGFDGGQACECPECKKSTPSDLVFLLMGELIDRLAVSTPNVVVETVGGYGPVHEPPKGTKSHDKLRVIWAHWGRHHGMGYDDDRYGLKDNLETWRKAVPGRLTLCQYYTDNFATPWVSAPYVLVLKGDRRYILDKGIDSVYMLVYPRGYWWNHGLNNYMAGVCYYDVSKDPYEVIRDWAMYYFGPAAGPLLAAYYTQWATEINLCYHVRDGSTPKDREMLARQRKLWIDPAVEAVKDDPLLSHRVGKVARLHRAAELLTEVHAIRERVTALRTVGKLDEARDALQEARSAADRVIAYMTEIANLNQGLIDKGEVPGFMTLGIKGWIGEEEKALKE